MSVTAVSHVDPVQHCFALTLLGCCGEWCRVAECAEAGICIMSATIGHLRQDLRKCKHNSDVIANNHLLLTAFQSCNEGPNMVSCVGLRMPRN